MTFSIREALRFGWEHTKAHSGLIFKVLLTLFALQVVSAIVSKVLEGTLIGILASIALGVGQFVAGVGLTLIALRIAQGKHVEYKDIIPPLQILWRYFAANFLVGLIIGGSIFGVMLVALAISSMPGLGMVGTFPLSLAAGILISFVLVIYLSIRYSMVRFVVLDGKDIIESLKASTHMTKPHFWHLLRFLAVLILVNIAGALALVVGLLVSIPVTLIAYAHVYQKLHEHHASR